MDRAEEKLNNGCSLSFSSQQGSFATFWAGSRLDLRFCDPIRGQHLNAAVSPLHMRVNKCQLHHSEATLASLKADRKAVSHLNRTRFSSCSSSCIGSSFKFRSSSSNCRRSSVLERIKRHFTLHPDADRRRKTASRLRRIPGGLCQHEAAARLCYTV